MEFFCYSYFKFKSKFEHHWGQIWCLFDSFPTEQCTEITLQHHYVLTYLVDDLELADVPRFTLSLVDYTPIPSTGFAWLPLMMWE